MPTTLTKACLATAKDSSINLYFDKFHTSIGRHFVDTYLSGITVRHLSSLNYVLVYLTSLLCLLTYLWFITVSVIQCITFFDLKVLISF